MAQQTIGIGSSANDGTGDTLRVAGGKINDNFTELYASVGSGTSRFPAVAISADTTLTAASHNNHAIEVTTSTTDKTLTLPTTGNTDGDEMIVVKADSSAGKVKFAALAGASSLAWLVDQYDWLRLHYSANMGWYVIAQSNIGPRYRSGSYIGPEASSTGSAQNGSATWVMYTPVIVRKLVTIAGMGVQVMTAGAAGTYLQLGLYTSKDGLPDTLLAQTPFASNQVPGDATGDAYRDFVGGNLTIPPGVYWMGVSVSSSAIAVRGVAANAIGSILTGNIGSTGPTAALASNTGYSQTGFTAGSSMPSPAGSLTGRGSTSAPTAVLKVA
jgi:hypothetical protein